MANLQEVLSIGKKIDLREIAGVPEPYRKVFAGYPHFNAIQSAIYDDVFYSDDPIAVSAPTGSGKTVIFELAIIRLLLNWEANTTKDFKIIYISPTKALCEERLVDWHKKFTEFGLSCISVTGDSPNVDISILINSKLIITTPEKWDSLTRRWRDNERVVRAIRLFMIDEIHLLNDETRGPALEAIVTRMKTIHSSYQVGVKRLGAENGIRLVGVSATISNAMDIAEWFETSGKPSKYFKFEENMRPVKLQKIVQGYPYNPSISSPFKFDIMLSYKLHNVLLQHSSGKPTLIFCSTRKSVEMTCKQLIQSLTIDLTPERKRILAQAASSLDDAKMRETLIHGAACHHAGMLREDRRTIETLFREGNLPVLVTTSTLAMGVNLPAHLVVIKSTKYYVNGEYRDYSESMLFQMIGRAGRPQFDTSAVAVIMTTAADKNKYHNMISGEQPVESYLHKTLAEHVNAEVVLRTITDLSIAMQWLSSTFLYIRARKNPKHYSLPLGLSQVQLDKKLLEICQIEINKLAKAGMLTIDQNILILPTRTGCLMAKYCAALETMKLFTEVTGREALQQVLGLISRCREFSDIRLRSNDKRPLNILNQNRNKKTIRFPLNGRIKTLDMKINCIIQAVLGSLEISESSLIVEAQRIMRVGERLLNCLSEYLEQKEDCYKALHSSLTLSQCFHAAIWENSSYVSRQLQGIGVCLSNLLVAAGKTTFKEILNSNPRDLERILNKKPPFGNKIQDQVKMLPQYNLTVKEVILDDGKVMIELTITLENRALFENDITVNPDNIMSLLVGDSENNVLLHEKYTHMYMIENIQVIRSVDIKTSFEHEIFINFISDNWVGIDAQNSIKLFTSEEMPKDETVQSTSTEKVQELLDSANSNIKSITKVKKSEKNRKTNMLQQCMDQYFKKVKTPKRENKTALKRKNSGQIKRKISASKLPGWKSENNNKSSTIFEDKTNKALSEENQNAEPPYCNKTTSKVEKENKSPEKDTTVSDIINSAINVYKEDSTSLKLDDNVTPEKHIDENDVVPATPVYRNLKSCQSRVFKTKNLTKMRKYEHCHRKTFDFEDIVYEESKSNLDISLYVKQPKRKMGEVKPVEIEYKKVRVEKVQEEIDNTTKSLTWRSPLIISPKTKHSPRHSKSISACPEAEETTSMSIPRKLPSLKNNTKTVSVSDKEYVYNSENYHLKYADFASESFLSNLRTSENTAIQNSISTIVSEQTRCDLNQTVSSMSSGSTNTSIAPKPKIIDAATLYTQIFKQTSGDKHVQKKCIGSQTESPTLSSSNKISSNNGFNNCNGELQNPTNCTLIAMDNTLPEKIDKSTEQYVESDAPNLLKSQQELGNKRSPIKRVDSWEEALLSNIPEFATTIITHRDDSNDFAPQMENKKDSPKTWSDNYDPDSVLHENGFGIFFNDAETKKIKVDKRGLSKNVPNSRIFEDMRYEVRTENNGTTYESPEKLHNNETFQECKWISKNHTVNKEDINIRHMKNQNYQRNDKSALVSNFTYENLHSRYLQPHVDDIHQRYDAMTSSQNPFYQEPFKNKLPYNNFYENLDNHSRRNNVEIINENQNLNLFSDNHFDNNFHQQMHPQNYTNQLISSDDYHIASPDILHNKPLSVRKAITLGNLVDKRNRNMGKTNTNLRLEEYLNNSVLLPQNCTSPFYEDANQDHRPSSSTTTEYFYNPDNKSHLKDMNKFSEGERSVYFNNINKIEHLRNIDRRNSLNKYYEADYTNNQNNNQISAHNSIERQYLPHFIYPNAVENVIYPINNYGSCAYRAPIRNPDPRFPFGHVESRYVDNNYRGIPNLNYRNCDPSQQHSMNLQLHADTKNKNDYISSRYFRTYSRPNTFDFDREQLNLNHTITSDYMPNLSPNF